MKYILWLTGLSLASWVVFACLAALLAAAQIEWLPASLRALQLQVSDPYYFAVLIGLPTLLCCALQIWWTQRVVGSR